MKAAKIFVVALCALALSAVLASCACSASTSQVAGTYSIYEIQGENGTSHEEIEEFGIDSLFFNLNEDGTFDFIFVGMDTKGTWSLDGKNLTLTPEHESIAMTDATLDGKTLTVTLYGSPTVFEKSDPKKVEDYI